MNGTTQAIKYLLNHTKRIHKIIRTYNCSSRDVVTPGVTANERKECKRKVTENKTSIHLQTQIPGFSRCK